MAAAAAAAAGGAAAAGNGGAGREIEHIELMEGVPRIRAQVDSEKSFLILFKNIRCPRVLGREQGALGLFHTKVKHVRCFADCVCNRFLRQGSACSQAHWKSKMPGLLPFQPASYAYAPPPSRQTSQTQSSKRKKPTLARSTSIKNAAK